MFLLWLWYMVSWIAGRRYDTFVLACRGNLPPYLSHNFRWLSYFFLIFFACYTNSFVRSFASSIGIMRSSLVISHTAS